MKSGQAGFRRTNTRLYRRRRWVADQTLGNVLPTNILYWVEHVTYGRLLAENGTVLLTETAGSLLLDGVWESDTGSAVEGAVVIAFSAADTGSGADAGTLAATLSGTETAAGAEGTVVLSVTLTGADTGSGTDAATLAVSVSVADTGAATETDSLSAVVSSADVGATVEDAVLAAVLAATESGLGADSFTLFVSLDGSDAFLGADAADLVASVSTSDDGSGGDSDSINDLGNGETQAVEAELDIGYSADDVAGRWIEHGDTGTGTEGEHEITYLVHFLTSADEGRGFDLHVVRKVKDGTWLSTFTGGKPSSQGRRLGGGQ